MTDHSGHRQRLKRSLRENGLFAFAPHEVIELILCSAIPRRDVNDLAHDLSDIFGGPAGLMKADKEALITKGGVSENTAQIILALSKAVASYRNSGACAGKKVLTRADLNEAAKDGMALLSTGMEVIFTSPVPNEAPEAFAFSRALEYDASALVIAESRIKHADKLKNALDAAGIVIYLTDN